MANIPEIQKGSEGAAVVPASLSCWMGLTSSLWVLRAVSGIRNFGGQGCFERRVLLQWSPRLPASYICKFWRRKMP